MCVSHPVGVSIEWAQHGAEEGLLQQCDHSADHGLQARQSAEVVGRVAGEGLGRVLVLEKKKKSKPLH